MDTGQGQKPSESLKRRVKAHSYGFHCKNNRNLNYEIENN